LSAAAINAAVIRSVTPVRRNIANDLTFVSYRFLYDGMRLMTGWLSLGLVLCLTAAAQDNSLPPETLLLSRIKARMAEQLDHLPNYTCLETIARFRAPRQSSLKPHDVVRLEIVYSDRKEWFASPGDATFTSTQPSAFIGSGFMATGSFAMQLYNIFVAGATVVTWAGEDSLMGPRAVRYDFRIPAVYKPLAIELKEGSGTAGEAGSFWVDRGTLELLAVETRADEIDPLLPIAETSSRVIFARTRIGDREAVLAQSADLQMLRLDGEFNFDRAEFTHCRAYQTTSVLHFGSFSDSATEAPAHPPAAVSGVVPPFLPVTVLLESPVSNRDAVGTIIRGRTSADMVHKGKVVVPRGSTLTGRIRRLERFDDNTWAVALEFTQVDAGGVAMRFFADATGLDPRKDIHRRLSEKLVVQSNGRPTEITLPLLYGVASFFVSGKSFTLPAGFKTTWRTRGLLR
jgi:hypothetical protein